MVIAKPSPRASCSLQTQCLLGVVMAGRRLSPLLLLSVLIVGLAVPAWAHPGHGIELGLSAGLAHPLSGLDHMLAAVAVGLWATQGDRRTLWALPMAFPLAMLAGLALGGFTLPFL